MVQLRWIVGTVLGFLAAVWLLTTILSGIGSSLFDEWKLVFQRQESGIAFWGLLLTGCGCVAAIVTLFRYEQQLISPRLGLTLLGLRMGLVVVVFLTLLEPVWSWTHDETRRQRLLLALDVSQSMETIDQQAPQAEQIRWAEAIGIIESEEARARAREWIAALQAGKEPEWVSPREEADFAKRKLLIQARQENLHSQLKEIAQLSRLELLRRACSEQFSAPIRELARLTDLQRAAFAQNAVPINQNDLQSTETLEKLDVVRTHSHLEQAAEATRQGTGNIPLGGVVLFSDGHETDAAQTRQVLARMQSLGVPVHTVLVGSEYRPRDLSILHIDSPDSVFWKDKPLVKCIVQTSGFEGKSVRLFLDDLETPAEFPLERTIVPQAPTAEVKFSLAELPLGRHRFRIRAEPHADETRDDNNTEEFSINVVDDRARVLLVDGESRWEFRFLETALARDDQISVDQILFEQPFLSILPHPFFHTSFAQLETAADSEPAPPLNPGTSFATYDLVLIGDVSPQDLTAQYMQQLDRYVREEGGTLVFTAGKRFFPMAYHGTLAEALLPIENLREIRAPSNTIVPPSQRGFRLAITPDGQQFPMFQLETDPIKSQRIWNTLPGHLWGIVGTARGGASVWASALMPNARKTLDEERQNGLIVQHYVGNGQVIWLGLESTWRWRYLVGDLYHHRFWGQFMRWAVSFKAAAGNEIVKLGLREGVIRAGQPAVIQARWDQRFLTKNPKFSAQTIIERQGGGPVFQQTLDLVPHPGSRLLFEAQALNLPAGEYKIRLASPDLPPGQELPETTLIVNAELTPELQDVSSNRSLLEQIATTTGGEFLYLNELDRLPAIFQKNVQTERIREEIPLYSHWLVLLLFSGIAMSEWVLRKWNGLP